MVIRENLNRVEGEKIDIHALIGKLPILPKKGFVLPWHKYTGPYNPLDKQLDENDQPIPGQEPYNGVDAISLHHDICYRDHADKKGECDNTMLQELKVLKPKNLREKIDRQLVRVAIGTKRKLGWGVEWSDELADELHKPIRRKFIKRKVFVKDIDDIWTADLVDMSKFAKYNKGYKYLLTIIDTFSKYGWIVPLKNKSANSVVEAFENVFKRSGRIPDRLWTDKGKEFYNEKMRRLLKKNNNIILYSTENEEKSSIVERWNRTMKEKMWKYFTANNTHVYIDVLQKLVDHYNNTYHRSIKTTPQKASQGENHMRTFKALYSNKEAVVGEKKPKFKVGDVVRIGKKKKTFEKGFTTNWTEELFTIIKVHPTNPWTYKIKDWKGEEVK